MLLGMEFMKQASRKVVQQCIGGCVTSCSTCSLEGQRFSRHWLEAAAGGDWDLLLLSASLEFVFAVMNKTELKCQG